MCGAKLAERLRGEFSEEQLVAARILIRNTDGEPALHDVLAGDSVCGLLLRETKEAPPFDFVNRFGSIATTDPPAFDVSRDHTTKRWSADRGLVFVVFSDADVGVAPRFGAPSHLEQLSRIDEDSRGRLRSGTFGSRSQL